MAFRPVEDNHRVGGRSNRVVPLDGIPEQVPSDEHIAGRRETSRRARP